MKAKWLASAEDNLSAGITTRKQEVQWAVV